MSDMCQDAGFILGPIVQILKILRWVIPILLIILVTFDLFKVVTSQADDKAKKEAFDKIVKRVLYAVIVFLVPTIINFILLQIEPVSKDSDGNISSTSTSYLQCWRYYYNK